MRKMKNYLKTGILLAGISLLLWNCQKENELILDEKLQIEPEIKLEKISLSELKQDKELNQVLNIIDSRLDVNQNKSILFSKEKIKTSDFTILTDEIIKITKNSTISYTFKIQNSNSDYYEFKNFMINKYSDDSYQFYLFEYVRSEKEGQSFTYGVSYKLLDNNLIDIADFDNLLGNKVDMELPFCAAVSYTICSAGGTGGHRATKQPDGSYCNGSTTIIDFSNCPADGGGETTGNTDSGGTIDDNNDTTGGAETTTIITSPIGISEYQAFWMSLSTNLQDYLGLRPNTLANAINYLNINSYAPQAQLKVTNVSNEALAFSKINNSSLELETFSELAIKAKLNGGDVDWVDRIIIDSSFVKSKANCAYKLLKDNAQFNQILDSLIPKDSEYNIIFKIGDPPGDATGSTSPNTDPNKQDITVTIDEWHAQNNSIVSIALTILHESVHARLIEKVKSLGGLSNLNEFAYLDSEMEKLVAYYNYYGALNNPAHHEFIWDNYLEILANGVESFHKLFPEDYISFHNIMIQYPSYNKNTFYELAVKGSLQETSYFKNLTEPEKIDIQAMESVLKSSAKKITNIYNCN